MNYQIETWGRERLPAAVEIIRRSFASVASQFGLTYENCPGNGAFITEERLRNTLKRNARLFILNLAVEAAGCIIAKRKNAEIWYVEKLAVLPQHRRQGYGRALLNHAEAYIWNEGGRQILIGIISTHNKLLRWYENAGYAASETREFASLPFSVLYLTKALDRNS